MTQFKAFMNDPRFLHAIGKYRVVNNAYNTPYLGGSNKSGDTIYQDQRFADRVKQGLVKYAGKPYDPRQFMNIHEATEGTLMRHFGMKDNYPLAHHFANIAERKAVEAAGGDWATHTAAMRPEIERAEKESGQGTPPDLLVQPYKGSKYENHVKANEHRPGTGNANGNRSAPEISAIGPAAAGGYNGGAPAEPDRGVQQSADDWPGEPDKGEGVRKFYLVRHGKTALNADDANQDKIRGWKDVPLDAKGKQEAVALGKKLANSGITFIAHSNMMRTKDTAEEIKKTTGARMVSRPGLRPWNVGVFQGESSGKVHPELRRMAEQTPDEPIPEGESFTQFKCRVFSSLSETLEESDGEHTAVVTHHRDERLVHAWIAGGQRADLSIDFGVMFQHGEAPANADVVAIDPDRLKLAAESACAELNKQGFQKYTHKAAGYHEDHGPPTPEHPEGSHCGVCRYYRGKDKCMIVVPPIGADDGCALFMPKGTKTGDGGGAEDEQGDEAMKVKNGKFGSTNWDEREGPGGGNVTGGPPMARTGAGGYDPELPSSAPGQLQSLMQSMTPKVDPGVSTTSPVFAIGGYNGGGLTPFDPIRPGNGGLTQPIPFGSAPSEQGIMKQQPWTEKDEERRRNLPTGGYGGANYTIGAGGPPKPVKAAGGNIKAPHMGGGGKVAIKAPKASPAHFSEHHRALGAITQLRKSGYLTTQEHDGMVAKARQGMNAHMAKLGSAKKVSAPPMSLTPPSAPGSAAGKSYGRGATSGGVTAIPYPVTPYAPQDEGGYGRRGGYGGLGSLAPNMQTQGPMGGNQQRMPWQQ